jgi:hypothetical protein
MPYILIGSYQRFGGMSASILHNEEINCIALLDHKFMYVPKYDINKHKLYGTRHLCNVNVGFMSSARNSLFYFLRISAEINWIQMHCAQAIIIF